MFPEKQIIDALIIFFYSTPKINYGLADRALKKFYYEHKYDFLIEDFTIHDVLLHQKLNIILNFYVHASYYYESKHIHPSRWDDLIWISRTFNLQELPNKGEEIRFSRVGNTGEDIIKIKGIFNILKFYMDNIQYCLDNYTSTCVVFLNNVISLFDDMQEDSETWRLSPQERYNRRRHFKNMRMLIDVLRGMDFNDIVFNQNPYIKDFKKIDYIKLDDDLYEFINHIHEPFPETMADESERAINPSPLNEVWNEYKKNSLYSLSNLEFFILNGFTYFKNKSKLKVDEHYVSSSILIEESFWWPKEHNSEFNINLHQFIRLILLYLKETYSLYKSIEELKPFIKRQPAEQRLSFAKNYSTRLQPEETLPFDILNTIVENYEISNPNITKRIYSENVDKLVRSKLEPRKTILDTYLDMLKDPLIPADTKSKIKKKIYNRLNREDQSHLYNTLVSPDIDPTMQDMYESPQELKSNSYDSEEKIYKKYELKEKKSKKKSKKKKKKSFKKYK